MYTHTERSYAMTRQDQIRDAFWLTFYVEGQPARYRGKRQNALPADVRVAFVDYVDYLQKAGTISAALAQRVTL